MNIMLLKTISILISYFITVKYYFMLVYLERWMVVMSSIVAVVIVVN